MTTTVRHTTAAHGPARTSRTSTAPLLDAKALDQVMHNTSLPAASPLRKAAHALDQTWGDENIMSGVVGTGSGHFPRKASSDELKASAQALLLQSEKLTEGDDLKRLGAVNITHSAKVSEAELAKMVKTIAGDGFCYESSNAALGPTGDLALNTATQKVKVSENDPRQATAFVLTNVKTNNFLVLYVRGGWD